ncbi:jg4459, partial [Pararge aegeria aegeria]
IILCDSSSDVPMAPGAAMNTTHILLLHVADPAETDPSYDVTGGSTTEERVASNEHFTSTRDRCHVSDL